MQISVETKTVALWFPGFGQDVLIDLNIQFPSQLRSDPADNLKISKFIRPQEDPAEQLVLDASIEMFKKLPVR